MSSKASEAFNALPFEIRKVVSGVITEIMIRDIDRDLLRAKRAYEAYRRDALSHRRNLEEALRKWEQEHAPTQGGSHDR